MPRSGIASIGPLGWSEEGRRGADVIMTHLIAHEGNVGRWVALRLSDGGSDGCLYEKLWEAMHYQLHPTQCLYMRVTPGGASAAEISWLIARFRLHYLAGRRPEEIYAAQLAREGYR